ncbi:uracil-DNA glycosylase family protein [Neisseria sp. 23W00296]|uniref:uracil-DNA glycosylase family protein n=1 Tax=unclassified Neisseria TaxID=2623750 RepID=UPI0037575065
MLSSRYLHLHEALDLGPMWLKRGAKLVAADAENKGQTAVQTASVPQTAATERPSENTAPTSAAPVAAPDPTRNAAVQTAAVKRPSENIRPSENARAAAMAAVGSSIGGYYKSQERAAQLAAPPERRAAETAAPVFHSVAEHKAALAASVASARVMAVSVCPAPEDIAAGRLFGGAAGVLLGNMFAAIGLADADVRRTSWLQNSEFSPSAAQIEAAATRVQAERELCGASAVLLLGRFDHPAHAAALPQVFAGIPVFAVPHPARLLRQPELKAAAWQELKRLRQFLHSAA